MVGITRNTGTLNLASRPERAMVTPSSIRGGYLFNGSLTPGNVNERESFGHSVYMRSTAHALITAHLECRTVLAR